jgi:glycine/D-amino acid oxidase-like deaminating enzyme
LKASIWRRLNRLGIHNLAERRVEKSDLVALCGLPLSFPAKGGAMEGYDAIIVGGGMVGAAIGCTLAASRMRVAIIDGCDRAARSSRGNFGLIWRQGKGLDFPAYRELTRGSIALWPEYAAEIAETSGIDPHLRLEGGLTFCLGEEEFARASHLANAYRREGFALLDRDEVQRHVRVPLGPEVTGALFIRDDGDVDPIRFLKAQHLAFTRRGGTFLPGGEVLAIAPQGPGFEVATAGASYFADRVVLAAGLGTDKLSALVGLHTPLRPQRGQILVTERAEFILPVPASGLKQTPDGTVMIGLTTEEVGHDRSTTIDAARRMALRATRIVPAIAALTLVRHWSCLRVMTPDSYPIYAASPTMPGLYAVACHSGITLAPIHAGPIAAAIASDERFGEEFAPFSPDRFALTEAA